MQDKFEDKVPLWCFPRNIGRKKAASEARVKPTLSGANEHQTNPGEKLDAYVSHSQHKQEPFSSRVTRDIGICQLKDSYHPRQQGIRCCVNRRLGISRALMLRSKRLLLFSVDCQMRKVRIREESFLLETAKGRNIDFATCHVLLEDCFAVKRPVSDCFREKEKEELYSSALQKATQNKILKLNEFTRL